jgi:membrane protein DedA with SNARE-associated domain
MHNLQHFINFVEFHRYWGYGLLYFSMIFEGELFLTAAGMLSRLHAFNIFVAFFYAYLGVLTGDMVWYGSGKLLKRKYPKNKLANFTVSYVKRFLPSIEKNPFHVIFISKFIYGLNHSTIFVLGFLEIPFAHFMRIQVVTSFIWAVIFVAVGYFFGHTAIAYAHSLDRFILIILLLMILLVVVEKIIGFIISQKEQKAKK